MFSLTENSRDGEQYGLIYMDTAITQGGVRHKGRVQGEGHIARS